MEDVSEGSKMCPFQDENEVSKFLGCSGWIKVRGCEGRDHGEAPAALYCGRRQSSATSGRPIGNFRFCLNIAGSL